MGTTSSAIFTGSSQFSADFQNTITRAVGLASLPITQYNSDVTKLQSQSDALGGIDTKFAALQTAVQGIADAMSGSSFQTEVSDTSAVSATVCAGAWKALIRWTCRNVGAYATSMTASNWDAGDCRNETQLPALGRRHG